MEKRQPKTWLFYAASNQRGAKWLEQVSVGEYVFWRHGSDAHTRQMRPGDTAVVYLAGETVDEGQIVAIGVIPSVRRPFILDNDHRVQRIPCLLVNDLRGQALTWRMIRAAIDVLPAANRGAVHPLDPEVAALIGKYAAVELPVSLPESSELIASSDLWRTLQNNSHYFSIFPDYIARGKRESLDLEREKQITSADEFHAILHNEWDNLDAEPDEDVDAIEDGEDDAATRKVGSAPPAMDFKEIGDKNFFSRSKSGFEESPDLAPSPDTGLEAFGGESYTGPAVYTARSFADTVDPDRTGRSRVDVEARAFARLIASESTKPPLSIGIFGRWGSGKTFFMTRIASELKQIRDHKREGFLDDVVEVEFNAWHYMETNVWASLVDVIFKELDTRLSSDRKDEQVSVFDRLSTAQLMRMDAIENLAARLNQSTEARKALLEAQREFKDKGPDGRAIWHAVLDRIIQQVSAKCSKEQLTDAATLLGYQDIALNVDSIQHIAKDLRSSVDEGVLLTRVLRHRFTDPSLLLGLAVMLIAIPLLAVPLLSALWLDMGTALVASLSATLAAWGSVVGRSTRKGLKLLHSVESAIQDVERQALAEHQTEIEAAQYKLSQASASLQAAEENAQMAFLALEEESPGAKLASFIRQRAESDDYSQHFGVIATIRKDFEQLSVLMKTDLANKEHIEKLEEFRKEMRARIDTLKSRYQAFFPPPGKQKAVPHSRKIQDASGDVYSIQKALKRLEESLSNKLKYTRPFSRIVLKIDDLDRCPPDKVADVLQAVHLFLNFPLFIILVCVDERWMSTSLIRKFETLVDGSGGATTGDYLEKIFQIPYWTRPMDAQASSEFANTLLSGFVQPFSGKLIPKNDPAPAETPIVDPKVSSINPVSEPSAVSAFANTSALQDNLLNVGPKEDASRKNFKGEEPGKNGLSGSVENAHTKNPEGGEADQQLPDQDDASATDSENGEAVKYAPLTLTEAELETIKEAAILAGDTPRRTLRFINVYMLIKSTMEPGEGDLFVDEGKDSFGHQALLIQLGLATRSDKVSRYYFGTLDHYKQSKPPHALRASEFLKILWAGLEQRQVGPGLSREDINLCGRVGEMLLALPIGSGKSTEEKLNHLSASVADQQLIKDIINTESLARRYTFIPPEANGG